MAARLSPLERRVLDAVDTDGLVAFAGELISIPSLGGEETPAQERMAAQMRSLGLDVDVWDIDFAALARHPAYTVEIEREHGVGVVATMGGGDGRSLILNGHIDVVSAGDSARWTVPPWRGTVRAGRLYGRGSADMKGALACALYAARAIADAGATLAGQLIIESVIGEEDGGCGTLACIERGYRADGAIVLEPTELMVAPAQAGALNFRIRVPGVAAHGCFRAEGVDPIEKFIPVYQALGELERRRNRDVAHPLFADYPLPYALSVGTVRAGDWPSTVGEELVCEGRYGIAVGEDLDTARGLFEEAVAAAASADGWLRDHPPVVEWWGAQFHPAETPAGSDIIAAVTDAVADGTGRETVVRGMPYGADMRLLVREGGTAAVICGPGDVRRAHAPNEYVEIDELTAATRVLALAALRFCGVSG
jgi:acetylornithine deacetylase